MRGKCVGMIMISIIMGILLQKVESNPASLGELTSSLQESFNNMSARRELWFDNYSFLKQAAQTDEVQLQELLLVSKMAIPLIWNLYGSQVATQKAQMPKLVDVGSSGDDDAASHPLPFHTTFLAFPPPPHASFFHVELTLKLHQLENFQIELLKDNTEQIFFLNLNFDERRAVMGNRDSELQYIQRVVLAEDQFPGINVNQPFKVKVQVADDCIFVVLWLINLDLALPMPLPSKHHWCTKDYTLGNSFTVNIASKQPRSPVEQQNSVEEQEEEEEDDDSGEQEEDADSHEHHHRSSEVYLVNGVVYGGVLIQ